MKCVQGVDEKARSARARQCSGNFCTDVSAFPDASDNKFALALQTQFNGLVKTFINVRYQFQQCFAFIAQAFGGCFSPFTHNSKLSMCGHIYVRNDSMRVLLLWSVAIHAEATGEATPH